MTRSETKDRLAKFPKASIPDVERYQVRLEALPQCSPKEFARAQPDWARRTRGSAMVEMSFGSVAIAAQREKSTREASFSTAWFRAR